MAETLEEARALVMAAFPDTLITEGLDLPALRPGRCGVCGHCAVVDPDGHRDRITVWWVDTPHGSYPMHPGCLVAWGTAEVTAADPIAKIETPKALGVYAKWNKEN